jgi:hypothetical protein
MPKSTMRDIIHCFKNGNFPRRSFYIQFGSFPRGFISIQVCDFPRKFYYLHSISNVTSPRHSTHLDTNARFNVIKQAGVRHVSPIIHRAKVLISSIKHVQ